MPLRLQHEIASQNLIGNRSVKKSTIKKHNNIRRITMIWAILPAFLLHNPIFFGLLFMSSYNSTCKFLPVLLLLEFLLVISFLMIKNKEINLDEFESEFLEKLNIFLIKNNQLIQIR